MTGSCGGRSTRRPTPAFRATAIGLVALTMAEVVWAATYLAVEETTRWMWLLPVGGCDDRRDAGGPWHRHR